MQSARTYFTTWQSILPGLRLNTGNVRVNANTVGRNLQSNRAARPRRHASTKSSSATQQQRKMSPDNPFYIPKPDPSRFPPISQRLKPLLPFIFYWTVLTSLAYHLLRMRTLKKEECDRRDAQISVLEGLVNRYRAALGVKTGTELDNQEVAWPDEAEVERELEMVGLRERTHLPDADSEVSDFQEARSVGWKEVLFGRKRVKLTEEEEEKAAEKEWRDGKCMGREASISSLIEARVVVVAAAASSKPPPTQTPRSPIHPSSLEPTSEGVEMSTTSKSKRAPSSAVFM